jgi:hypothetical protein
MYHHLIHNIPQMLMWISYLNTVINLPKTIVTTYQSTRKMIRRFQHRYNQHKSR